MERKTKENQTSVLNQMKWYRKKIAEMANQIDNEKFLKRIYISLRDYTKEE